MPAAGGIQLQAALLEAVIIDIALVDGRSLANRKPPVCLHFIYIETVIGADCSGVVQYVA